MEIRKKMLAVIAVMVIMLVQVAQVHAQTGSPGTYFFTPRIRAHQGGVPKNLYIDRIVIRGDYLTIFFTGSATGRGGDGEYHNFWDRHDTILLDNLDRSGRPINPINQGEDDDSSNPDYTNGFFLMFQGVTGTRFNLTGTRVSPPWTFDEINLAGAIASAEQTAQTIITQAAELRSGTYTFTPRIRVNQAGVGKNLYIDRIIVQGQYFTIFFTGSATGRGGDGEYHNFWSRHDTIFLENLDRPGRPINPVNQGEDDDSSNPMSTNGFFLTFQGVTGTRLRLTATRVSPPWTFDEIIIGEPDS